jgi:hypothetical protein
VSQLSIARLCDKRAVFVLRSLFSTLNETSEFVGYLLMLSGDRAFCGLGSAIAGRGQTDRKFSKWSMR